MTGERKYIPNETNSVPDRLARLEAVTESLAGGLHEMQRGQDDLAREMRKGFERIQEDRADRNKTPWAILISFAGLIIIVGGLVLVPIDRQISSNKVNFDAIDSRQRDHEILGMHSAARNEFQNLVRRIDELEELHPRVGFAQSLVSIPGLSGSGGSVE